MLGRCILWQVPVYAPGTANSATFLPLKISSVVLTCGPSAVITRNFASGSLSPTWIVIVQFSLNVRVFLKPSGWPAQYSVARKRQWRCAFTVLSSAGKPSGVEEGLFFGRHFASQNAVTMRKASEPADDVGVPLGISDVLVVGGGAEQLDAAQLIGQMLRMHERHIEEFEQRRLDARIGAAVNRAARDLARLRVAGIGHGVIAKHVAGKLVEHDGERQRAVIGGLPGRQFARDRLPPQLQIAAAHRGVEGVVAPIPAVAAGVRPEVKDFSRCSFASVSHDSDARLAIQPQAAAFFSSRSSRRRIFPTLVLG